MKTSIKGYITRNKDGNLLFHSEKPERFHEDGQEWWVSKGFRFTIPARYNMFPDLKWEDNFKEVKLVLKEDN